jgi:hypothetical protein
MKKLVLIVGVIGCLFSCEKNDKKDEIGNLNSAYLPMSVGNYWIYQIYDLDSYGNENQTNTFDSTVITKDTLINGKKYYRFDCFQCNPNSTSHLYNIYYRDSLKHLITSKGQIWFSEDNFIDTLYKRTYIYQNDTIYTMTCKMERLDQEFNTPIGNFYNLLNFKATVLVNSEYTDIENPRYTNHYYVKDLGLIYQSEFGISSDFIQEKRLIRYNINK